MDTSTDNRETIASDGQTSIPDAQSPSPNNQTVSDNQTAYTSQQISREPVQISSNEDHANRDDQITERFHHITTTDHTAQDGDKEKNHIDEKDTKEDKEKDEGEDREKGEDEQKEVEKTLLEDDSIRIEIDKADESFPLGDEGEDTPTLPMPDKKRKQKENEKEFLKKPSTFLFPITRLRKAWNSSSNILEFMIRATCIICTSLGWLFCVGGFPFVSVVMLIMGSVYFNDCPAKPEIPIYLVVAGVCGTVQHVFAIWTKYVPRDTESPGSRYRGWCLCIDFLLQFFLGIWFILGCVWVYGLYEPEYEIVDYPGEINRYCSKSVYLFTFWMLNISFITLAILICFAFCCMISIAASSREVTIKE